MLKKILYHSGFATLGIALLVGMGILQANGLRNTEDVSADSDSAVSTPVDDSAAPDVAAVTATTSDVKPMEVASLPPSTPAPQPAPVVKNPLDDATAFSIYDTAHKTSSKKNFKATTADLQHAMAYYDRLAHHHKHAVIKARVNGDWVSVSAKDFNAFLKNASDQ